MVAESFRTGGRIALAPKPNCHAADGGESLGYSWSDAHANFLSSLSKRETDALLLHARRVDLEPRDQLFRAGDPSNDLYLVASGCIRLFQVSSTGKETILWFSFPGEIFGIAELLRGSNREIYAEANDVSHVYAINYADFKAFLGTHPEAAMRAIAILSARVRSIGHALAGLATDNVETRIARLLLKFATVSSVPHCGDSGGSQELCVNIRLTHQDIANLIGASRQTVTTTLAELKKSGTLRQVDRHIHIVEPRRLGRILDQTFV